MLYVQYSHPSNQRHTNKPFARLLLLPIGEQLRSVTFRIIKRFVVLSAPGFALDNEKHISACVGHANIGASTLGVVPEMPFFSSSICSGRYPLTKTAYAFKYNEVLFLIKTIVALSALYFIWINQLFAWKSTFRLHPISGNTFSCISPCATNPRVSKASFKFEHLS